MKKETHREEKFVKINANPSSTLDMEEFKHAMKLGREREEDLENLGRDRLPGEDKQIK